MHYSTDIHFQLFDLSRSDSIAQFTPYSQREYTPALPSTFTTTNGTTAGLSFIVLRFTYGSCPTSVRHLRQVDLSPHPSQDPLKGNAFLAALSLHNHTGECLERQQQQAHADLATALGYLRSAVDADGTVHADRSCSGHAFSLQSRYGAQASWASRTASTLRAHACRAPAARRDAYREQHRRHRRR